MKLSCQSFKSCTKKQEVGNDQFKRLCSKSTICKKKSKSLKHVIKGLCDFIEGSSSTTLPDLVTIRYCGSGDKMFFNLSRELRWPQVQRIAWQNGFKFLIVSHHYAKFIDHRPCGSSDIAAKIFYVTLQDYMIKGSGDFMKRNSLMYIHTLPKLTAIDFVLMDM